MAMLQRSWVLVGTGFAIGVAVSAAHFALATSSANGYVPTQHAYSVSIDEIKQNFVFGDQFSGTWSHTVKMSDGSIRKITLTPVVKNGVNMVQLSDNQGLTYMGANGTTTNGSLMINVKDMAEVQRQFGKLSQAQ